MLVILAALVQLWILFAVAIRDHVGDAGSRGFCVGAVQRASELSRNAGLHEADVAERPKNPNV
jgi:hypothetical protein